MGPYRRSRLSPVAKAQQWRPERYVATRQCETKEKMSPYRRSRPSIPGFSDNGDVDDVVLFLTSGLHLFDTVYPPLISASETVSEGVFEHLAGTVGQRAYEPGTPRAPPAAYGIPR